jgi:hypothetical protein
MVVLQTILIVALVYYALKLLAKWLLPRFLNYAVKKTQDSFSRQFNGATNPYKKKEEEGTTSIFKKPFPKSNPSKKVGEYIDFEEIE